MQQIQIPQVPANLLRWIEGYFVLQILVVPDQLTHTSWGMWSHISQQIDFCHQRHFESCDHKIRFIKINLYNSLMSADYVFPSQWSQNSSSWTNTCPHAVFTIWKSILVLISTAVLYQVNAARDEESAGMMQSIMTMKQGTNAWTYGCVSLDGFICFYIAGIRQITWQTSFG